MSDNPYDDDDDDELELEPLDAEVVEHQKREGARRVRQASQSVDLDQVYDEQKRGDLEFDPNWIKQIRFTTRHLLIATAALAVALTLYMQFDGCMLLFGSFVTAVALGWFFVMRQERALVAERRRRRAEIEASYQAASGEGPDFEPAMERLRAETRKEEELAAARPRFDFSFQFSMKQLLIAFTVAAVALGLTRAFGEETMTMLLGFTALVGLITVASGYEPPRLLVLGWWMLLVMYVLVGVSSAIFG